MKIFTTGFMFVMFSFLARAADVGETRSTLEEWVLTEKTISEERESWLAEKSTMADLIRLLEDERATLDKRRAEAEAVTTQAEARRGELLEQKERLRAASDKLKASLATYEAALLEMGPRLPEPLLRKVQPLMQRLPESGKATLLSVGQRAQNLVGILGEVDKFNREVTVDTQIQSLPDGRAVEVRVLYLGLGAAYFADVSGRHAGILTPGPEGWQSVSRPELAEVINETIAQYERNSTADFIGLPVEIR